MAVAASQLPLIGVASVHDHERTGLLETTTETRKPFDHASSIQRCGSPKFLAKGKLVHSSVICNQSGQERYFGNLLVEMYAKCGVLHNSILIFERICHRNIFSWNIMIAAYVRLGQAEGAIWLFWRMQHEGVKPNKYTFSTALHACSCLEILEEGRRVHYCIENSELDLDVVVGTALVSMYSKCGSLSDARWVFERMPERNVVSWSTMISSYAQNEHGKEALQLFKQMESQSIIVDKIAFVGILDACTSLGNLREGKRIHSCILCSGFESNIVVRTALINMYGKSGSLEVAKMLFNRMSERDTVSWNAIINAYSHNGNGRNALELFRHLLNQSQEPDRITYVTILKACSDLTSLAEGKHIHAYIMDSQFCTDAIVGTAVVNMYGKCKRLDDAQRSFDKLTNPDLQSWNSIIAAYSQNEPGLKALQLFQQMQLEGLEPNSNTFISVLDACASLSALDQGKTVHAQIVESGLDTDVLIGTALINMYGKCGRLDDAQAVLQNASVRNFISCNAMIAAYGHNGHGKEALLLFQKMQLEGMLIDKVTCLGILYACSHAGLVDEGYHQFSFMVHHHGFIPEVEHFGSLSDLLGRAYMLYECEDLIIHMPIQPSITSLRTLLAAYRSFHIENQGKHVAEQALELLLINTAIVI